MHFAMKTLAQPSQKSGFCVRQVDTGHANLGKSQFLAPSLNLRDELNTINHLPCFVETATCEADTEALAQRLARSPALADAIVTLHGNLGAGKTTWVRHLLRALGVGGRVKSPTYAVVEGYQTPPGAAWPQGLAVSHFDFYRFNDPQEWEDAGFRELFAEPGLKLVEWPEKAAELMPGPDASLTLTPLEGDGRRIEIKAHTATGQQLLQAMRP
ncbi:MAG: tRNA ((37)-N6)-threonylcarbamoyltransferase complex ATPase subunit type 1 TsaE [Pseudomonadota bacterium]|jgi:tRNA threonylcarbamoyladenosine biosynthesis protein TsaE